MNIVSIVTSSVHIRFWPLQMKETQMISMWLASCIWKTQDIFWYLYLFEKELKKHKE